MPWFAPLINRTELEVVLEWWCRNKKLTVYIENNTKTYIKVWGVDIDNEMEEGIISSDQDFVELWKWLILKSKK